MRINKRQQQQSLISIRVLFVILLGVVCFAVSYSEAREYKRFVSLEFESVEGASGYEVKVQRVFSNGEKKAPVVFKLSTPLWEATINYGKYELTLRTYDDRGVPGDWSEPMEFLVRPASPELLTPKSKQKITTAQEDRFKVPFSWKPVPGATAYELTVTDLSNNESKVHKVENSQSLDLNLDVAKSYSWKVTSIMEQDLRSEDSEAPQEFQLIGKKLEAPEIDEPTTKFPQKITWDPPDHADAYTYALYFKNKKGKWRRVESKKGIKQPEIPFNLANPTGEYMLKVRAEGQQRLPSELASQTFHIQGGLRSPAAIEAAQLKDSLSKPTNFYAIASYFVTQMNYTGDRYESGKRSTFQGLGGTGRLGIGYQNPNYRWGTFGVIDMGGISINGENFTFASAELHGTWNFNLTQFSIFQASGGLYMKELPELQGNSSSGVTGVSKAKNMGPHVGFKYWIPFNYRMGLQFNGRAYYSLLGTAPNGKEVQPSLSYQAGVLGSLKISKAFMGYAGYAYRLDQSSYNADPDAAFSSAQPGDVNLIQLQGHYLNLILEYSF